MDYIYKNNTENRNVVALKRELSRRYGGLVAAQIIDAIRKARSGDRVPDCLVIKACGDMLDVFRRDTRKLLRQLRVEHKNSQHPDGDVDDLNVRRLEREFRHIYRLYWISMKLFYPAYRRAMDSYRGKIGRYSVTPHAPHTLATAA